MRTFLLHIGLLISLIAIPQAQIQVGVSKVAVQEGESFRYEIIMNRNCELKPPSFEGFDLLSGPMIGQSSSYSNYNGSSSQNTTYSYTYTLQAKKKGEYKIGAPTMNCGKEKVIGEEVTIKVVELDQINQSSDSGLDNYVQLTTSKKTVFVGEPFIITTTFFSTEQPSSIESIVQGTASNLNREEIMLNRVITAGTKYYQVDLSKELCYATRVGNVEIMPYSAVLQKEIDFFNVKRLEGISNKLNIEVKALPDGAPDYFNGLVGDVELIFAVSKTTVNIGEAIDLDITIKGIGNFKQMDDPVLNLPESFHVHDPEIIENTKVTPKGIDGEVKYRFVIVPSEAGSFDVQPFAFAFFNINSRKYEAASTEMFTITVANNEDGYGQVVKNSISRSTPKITSLSALKQSKEVFNSENSIHGSGLHVVGLTSPLLIVFSLLMIRKYRTNISEERKLKGVQKGAAAVATRNLKSIKVSEGDTAKQVKNILDNFLMAKLVISRSEISKERILAELKSKTVSEKLIDEVNQVWNKLEMAAYGSMNTSAETDLISNTEKLIFQLNSELK